MTACERHKHPLDMAHSLVTSTDGDRVYLVCGWQGCAQRRRLDRMVWEAERQRRDRLKPQPEPAVP